MRMLGAGRDSMLATTACRALAALTFGHPTVQHRAAGAGACEALLFLCTAGPTAPAAAPAAAALAAACDGRRSAAAAAAAGGATDVLTALLPARGAAAAAAATALAALAASSGRAATAVDASGAVPALGSCLAAAAASTASPAAAACDSTVVRAAARLVRGNADHADTLVSAGAADTVATMLCNFLKPSNSTDEATQHSPNMWCIQTLPDPKTTSPKPPGQASTSSSPQGSPSHDSTIPAVHDTHSCPSSPPVDSSTPGSHEDQSTTTPGQSAPEPLQQSPSDTELCVALKLVPKKVRGELQRPQHSSKGHGLFSGATQKTLQSNIHGSLRDDERLTMSKETGKGAFNPPGHLQWAPVQLWDASEALARGWEDLAELIVTLCEASPGAQSALRKSGLVDTVVRFYLSIVYLRCSGGDACRFWGWENKRTLS